MQVLFDNHSSSVRTIIWIEKFKIFKIFKNSKIQKFAITILVYMLSSPE